MPTPVEIARSAKRILSDPGFIAAVDELDAACVNEWRTAQTTEEREATFYRQEGLSAVVRQLATIVSREETE